MDKKSFSICYSDDSNPKLAIQEISMQMENSAPALIMFFSSIQNFAFYTEELTKLYPNTEIIGTTTYVALSSKGASKTALTAIALFDGIECAGGIITDVRRFPQKHTPIIRESLSKISDTNNCCCIEFTTAFDACEEIIQDTFRSVLEEYNIAVVGGSAGNAGDSTESYVAYNGTVYSEACVFVIVKNLLGAIHLFCENIYKPTDQFFYATDVDCEERKVYEFDGKPATKVLAKALNVSEEELPSVLPFHPLGRMTDGNIYITDFNQITEDGAMSFFARIYNRTKMALMVADDVQSVLSNTIQKIHDETKTIRFMLVVNCLSRSKRFESEGVFELFTDRLRDELGEYVGFSGYGEQINYEHLNKTMLIAIFE